MRVRAVFFLLLLSLLLGVAAYAIIYFLVPWESPGRGYGSATQRYAWIPVAIVPVAFSIGLLAYQVLFPEISQKPSTKVDLSGELQPLAAVMKVLKDDERQIIELLISAEGRMLQRDIARQTGFSRVKTHRILYRLATRGIITAEKYYNTYQITVAKWLFPRK